MYHWRRLTAALSTVFVLQLVFVESGYACPMSRVSDMGGMAMTPVTHAGHPAPEGPRAPCRFPWAPDGCQSMAPCAPATLLSAAPALSDPPAPVIAVPVLAVLTPPSASSPPDHPPPRF